MPAEPRALVTRPAGQADALIDGLRLRGFAVLHLPMLAIEALGPLPARQRQHLLDLDHYGHLIFISSNAARFGVACIDDFWPQYPVGLQCWAVGDSTAQVLRRAGLSVQFPEHDMSSEGLLALPGLRDISGEKVLIVKGEGGRDTLARTLTERGALVHTLNCYRRVPAVLDGQYCRAQLGREPVNLILISSGEGLSNLTRLLQPEEHTNLAHTAMIVPSARVEEQARDIGWRSVRRADNASDPCMLAMAGVWARETGAEIPGGEQQQ